MKKKKDVFTDSEKHSFNGTKLEPWTPARVIAAQSMGMLYPQIGKEGWDQFKRTKVYAGVIKDISICLWLCHQTVERVDEADCAPAEAYSEARTWAAGRGIHRMNSDEFWTAYGLFTDIMSEVNKAMTVPEPNDEDPDEGN